MDGGWHFIVVTLNATNNFYNFTIYLDGVLPISFFTQTVVNASSYNCGVFTPGMELGDVQAKNYVGSYALFTQYNFTLSANQVYQLYQAQKPSCLSVCYAFGATSQSCQNLGGNYSLGSTNSYGCFINPSPFSLPLSFSSFPSSLIGSYPLVNSLTNYITGSSLGNSTVMTFTSGTRGNALTLTGSFTLAGDINIGSSYTVCIWMSVSTFGGGNTLWTILGTNALNLGFQANSPPASIVQGRGYFSVFSSQTKATNVVSSTGTWQHYCFTFNALSGQATIYYNAANVAQNYISSTTWGPTSLTNGFTLFGFPTYSYDLTGYAQCLRIWSIELDLASISSEYTRTTSSCPLQ